MYLQATIPWFTNILGVSSFIPTIRTGAPATDNTDKTYLFNEFFSVFATAKSVLPPYPDKIDPTKYTTLLSINSNIRTRSIWNNYQTLNWLDQNKPSNHRSNLFVNPWHNRSHLNTGTEYPYSVTCSIYYQLNVY